MLILIQLVPVIAVFTKFDSLDAQAFHRLHKEGISRAMARVDAPGRADQDFDRIHLPVIQGKKYPPTKIVRLRSRFLLTFLCIRFGDDIFDLDMHKGDGSDQKATRQLMSATVEALSPDMSKKFRVSVQRNNVALCIQYAIRR